MRDRVTQRAALRCRPAAVRRFLSRPGIAPRDLQANNRTLPKKYIGYRLNNGLATASRESPHNQQPAAKKRRRITI
jgi:hypothetical protein